MNSPLEIVPFTTEHVVFVVQWDVGITPEWSERDWQVATQLRRSPDFEALTLLYTGQPVGVIVADARWETGVAKLLKLLVHPQFRRIKVATTLLTALASATRRNGLTLVADVHESHTAMHCLLRKFGLLASIHIDRPSVYQFQEREPDSP